MADNKPFDAVVPGSKGVTIRIARHPDTTDEEWESMKRWASRKADERAEEADQADRIKTWLHEKRAAEAAEKDPFVQTFGGSPGQYVDKGVRAVKKLFEPDEGPVNPGKVTVGTPEPEKTGGGGSFLQKVAREVAQGVKGATPAGGYGEPLAPGEATQMPSVSVKDFTGPTTPPEAHMGSALAPGEALPSLSDVWSNRPKGPMIFDVTNPIGELDKLAFTPEGREAVAKTGSELVDTFNPAVQAARLLKQPMVMDGLRAFAPNAAAALSGSQAAPTAPSAANSTAALSAPPGAPQSTPGTAAPSASGVGMRLATSTRGARPGAMDGAEAMLKEGLRKSELGLQGAAGTAQMRADDEVAAVHNEQASLIQAAVDQKQAAATALQATKNKVAAYERIQTALENPQEVPDPGRFWATRSTGQKILAGVSVILGGAGAGFGLTGNRAMDIIQDAIKQDVQLQREGFENKREALKGAAQGALTTYELFRKQGMDEMQASELSIASAQRIAASQFKLIAAKYGAPEAKAKLLAEAGKLEMDAASKLADFESKEQAIQAQKMALWLQRKAAEAKGKDGESIKDQTAMNLGNSLAVAKQFRSYATSFGDKSIPYWSSITGSESFPLPSDAKLINSERSLLIRTLGKAVDDSVLMGQDMVQWEKIIPLAGDPQGTQKLAQIGPVLLDKFDAELASLQARGSDISTYLPMRDRLRAQIEGTLNSITGTDPVDQQAAALGGR